MTGPKAAPEDDRPGPQERRPPQPRHTHPAGLLLKAVQGLGQAAVPIIAGIVGTGVHKQGGALLALVVLALGGASIALSWLGWRRLTYTVGAEDIRVESGIISRAARSVPYERIQDVSLERKLLARLLGLVEVRFETGAGGKDELVLSYVSAAEGERLRELVRERRDGEAGPAPADTALADAASKGTQVPIFAMDDRRLLTFGLFEFSLAIFAVLLGAAQQFDFLFPFDIWDWPAWAELLGEPGQRIDAVGGALQLAAALLGLVAVVLVGLATGIIRTFLRDYGFRLDRTARGLRRRRGLLTVTDVVMPVHRVQAVEIGTRLVRYRFGWHALKLVSLAQDMKSASHVAAPFARMEEIRPLVRAAGLAMPGQDPAWIASCARAWSDSAVLAGAIPLLVALGLILFAPQPWWALVPLAALGLIALAHWLGWRRQAHALEGGQIILRHGIFSPQLKNARCVKLQSVEVVQGPLARRRGYATLELGLAGGSFSIGQLELAEARRLRDGVLASILAVDFSALQAPLPAGEVA